MRYPASETAEKHERILQTASRLFRRNGFSGVSVGEIMRATGLTHGPFYNHFASKEALMSESMEHASRGSIGAVEKAGESAEDLLAHIDEYVSTKHRDEPEQGCLLASLATEVSREPAVKPALTQHVSTSFSHLAKVWRRSSKKVARREAIHALSSMVGAMVLARAVDDPELSDEILANMREALRQSIQGTVAKRG